MNPIEKNGVCVVLAGAGTGKTYTIVEKIKHLAENGKFDLAKVVCITFSNEAANNLTLRIDKILGERKDKPVIRTFHGFSADLLRKYGDRIGINGDFKILDPEQAMVVIHRSLKVNPNFCGKYIGTIGTAKDLGIALESFQEYLKRELERYPEIESRLENLNFELQTLHLRKAEGKKKMLFSEIKKLKALIEIKRFVAVWNAYEKIKQKGNYQDYSDLNKNALLLLEKNPEIAGDYQYIIVDEFQDTNKLQLDFLIKLAVSQNIMVVGDINQSIYRFRGAYKENLNLFKKAFDVKPQEIFNLDKSYRSSNKILRTAHKLILNNYTNKEECFFVDNVHNREGENIEVYELKNAKEEARKVIELIKRENEGGTALEEICILFRAHQYGRIIKRALEQAGIQYFSVSKASLLKQKSVKTVQDYLSVLQKLKKKVKGGEAEWWDLVYQLDFSHDDLIKLGKLIKDFNKKLGKSREKSRDENNGGLVNNKDIIDSNSINNDSDVNSGRLVNSVDINNSDKISDSSINKDNLTDINDVRVLIDNSNVNEINNVVSGKGKGKNGLVNEEDFILSQGNLSVYLFNNLTKIDFSDSGKLSARVLTEKIKLLLPCLDGKVSDIIQEVFRVSGLTNEQKINGNREEMLNLNKFYELAKTHEELYDSDLENFLYYLEILDRLGIEIDAARLEEKGVRLMTSHATKGLEYKTVIVTNMAQGRFPIERWVGNSLIPTELLPEINNEIRGLSDEEKEDFVRDYEKHHQLLDERRLAYVSFTRAKENLIFTYALEYGDKKFWPSTFLSEIAFKTNADITFKQDLDEKYSEPEVKNEKSDFSKIINALDFESELAKALESEKVKKEHQRFSPSALILFDKCQKEFEYKYVFNMPERKTQSWEAMRLGSFVHLVLEQGVKHGFGTAREFLDLARELSMDEDWEGLEFGEVETIIKVFFERHKGKYNSQTKTEQFLPLKLAGMDFIGFADRIDFSDKGYEIIDYKTGKWAVAPKERNWQLGFYALAAREKYGKVNKVVLEMLRQEKPLEFEIDDRGNAQCVSSDRIDGFNIYEVEQELIQTAHRVQEAYRSGFKPCSIEKNCEFCNEYVYNL